jgi:farnesyl diphosphate synthase
MTLQPGEFDLWLRSGVAHVEKTLDRLLPGDQAVPFRLHEAMRYSVMGGGKRVRAALVYAAARAVEPNCQAHLVTSEALDFAACAVELIHAYSLIHDDLPCMDDDVLRRGKPTVHVQFDEACALLAGDAMQPLAFEWLARMQIEPSLVVAAVSTLAQASGSQGMAGGQAIDLDSVGLQIGRDRLEQMHQLKTGALLGASVRLGGLVAGAASAQLVILRQYSEAMGLAFQVVDDILDVTADSAALGKTPGKDAAANKPTYVSVLGLEAAQIFAKNLHRQALDSLKPLGQRGQWLAGMADFILLRHH